MTLDEAIKHTEEVAEEKEKEAWEAQLQEEYKTIKSCKECAKEHRQLAEWLKELKQLREQTRWIPINEGDKLPSDWVFVQIQQNNGYLWEVPCVALYQESEDDWIIVNDNVHYLKGYINKELYWEQMIKVIAWMPLPKQYKPEESKE